MSAAEFGIVFFASIVLVGRLLALIVRGVPLAQSERVRAADYYARLYRRKVLVRLELRFVDAFLAHIHKRRGMTILEEFEDAFAFPVLRIS